MVKGLPYVTLGLPPSQILFSGIFKSKVKKLNNNNKKVILHLVLSHSNFGSLLLHHSDTGCIILGESMVGDIRDENDFRKMFVKNSCSLHLDSWDQEATASHTFPETMSSFEFT